MVFIFRVFGLVMLALILSSCGPVADLVQFADNASQARDRNTRVANLANTSFLSMPDTGSVSYNGHAVVAYVQNGTEVALLGQSTVTANFTDQQISGRVDQVFGGTGLSDLQSYDGALTFEGQIGLRRPNSFDAVMTGSLIGGGQTITLTGPLLGDFRGQGAQAIAAMSNGQMQATVNGVDAPVRLRVMAER